MVLKTKGIPSNIKMPIVGIVSWGNGEIAVRDIDGNIVCILSTGIIREMCGVYTIADLGHLCEGDIVAVHADGVVNTVYRTNSAHNFLLFTERCNSNCLMCSQPPRDRDDTGYLFDLHSKTISLIPKDCFELGITGGEPTLLGDRFFHLMKQIKYELPDTEVHCLTNGRSFAWPNMAARLGDLEFNRLMLGIPIYSDSPFQHDYIVQAKDAFNQTVRGLYNLAKHNVRVELRIVLHQQTIPRLMKLAGFIYKNLPFADHVTFMGLEHQGYTPYNIEKLWIDPLDYGDVLSDAVAYLSDMGMCVSVYNAQLCTIPKDIWPYARKSISDWKNVYHEECGRCSVKDECGGFFASGMKKYSRGIMAIE
jgi:His-Xaa-Ser system radical SAM maturase HxsC